MGHQGTLGDTHILYVTEDVGAWIGMVGGMPTVSNGEARAKQISLWADPACRGVGSAGNWSSRSAHGTGSSTA